MVGMPLPFVSKFRGSILIPMRLARNAALSGFVLGMLLVLSGGMVAKANEPIPVKVGAYEYGVVYFYQDGEPRGMAPSLIDLLNDFQDEYAFELSETSSRRRYQAVVDGEVDLVLLESSKWDWENYDVRFSGPIVQEEDLYVALADRGNAEALFSDIASYPMLCVLGFHYGFADFNADPAYLRQNFDVLLRYNEKEVLAGLLAGEAPIGVVSAGFLAAQFGEIPGLRNSLVIADQPDATYDLVSVLSEGSAIPLERFNQLVSELRATGEVERLWQQFRAGLAG